MIDVSDWDDLVTSTYGKHYNFQQQNDCRSRGIFDLTIPSEYSEDNDMHDSIPEEINGEEMGVKFDVWLNSDLEKHKQNNNWSDWEAELFWERNFYPDIHTLANDLHKKGLIEAGTYSIKIDW